jgi:hypothetical protein
VREWHHLRCSSRLDDVIAGAPLIPRRTHDQKIPAVNGKSAGARIALGRTLIAAAPLRETMAGGPPATVAPLSSRLAIRLGQRLAAATAFHA